MKQNTRKLTAIAMLTAVSFIAVLLAHVLPPIMLFLRYDPKDVVIAIGGFLFGPLSAFLVTVFVCVIEAVTISSTGPIGLIMNVLASCSFACVAAYIYRKRHTMRGAVIGLVCGWLLMTVVMLLWNYLITPLYMMNTSRADVAAMLIPVFLPFNLLKGGLNAALTMLLYKPVVNALRRSHLIPETETTMSHGRINTGAMLASGAVVVTCILIILVMQGVI